MNADYTPDSLAMKRAAHLRSLPRRTSEQAEELAFLEDYLRTQVARDTTTKPEQPSAESEGTL